MSCSVKSSVRIVSDVDPRGERNIFQEDISYVEWHDGSYAYFTNELLRDMGILER